MVALLVVPNTPSVPLLVTVSPTPDPPASTNSVPPLSTWAPLSCPPDCTDSMPPLMVAPLTEPNT
jgi:hypothetical protein